MKKHICKFISLLLAFFMVGSIAACGTNSSIEDSSEIETITATEDEETSDSEAADDLSDDDESVEISEEQDISSLDEILSSAEVRKNEIASTVTDVNYSGKAYYVSNNGNDENDGTSYETAWATLDKVNSAGEQGLLESGDAVFFERGGLWRGWLKCAKGVTYSAYGEGEKPRIYGSPEDGSGGEKWELWYDEDGVKIWKYYHELTEVGNIVFDDGDSYATRVYSYYNGEEWVVSGADQHSFDVVENLRDDLTFYSTYELTSQQYQKYVEDCGGTADASMIDLSGSLYLRCDEGNPGELYSEIEFHCTPEGMKGYNGLVLPAGDNVIDNLCLRYCLENGIAIYGENDRNDGNDNNIIQNCEIGWMGGTQHDLNRDEGDVMVCGEAIVFKTDYNVIRNNYIHQACCAGIVSEFVENEFVPGEEAMCIGNEMTDNVIEKCQDTFWFWPNNCSDESIVFWENMTISGNYVLFMGYGWSSEEKFTYPTSPVNTYHVTGEDGISGDSICLNFGIYGWEINNVSIKDNVFCVSGGEYLLAYPLECVSNGSIDLSGNVYVTRDIHKIYNDGRFNGCETAEDAQSVMRDPEDFGDEESLVFVYEY